MPRLKAFKWTPWAEERYERFLDDAPEVVSVDTETSGVAFYDEPFCATLSWRGKDGSLQNAYIDLEDEGKEHRLGLLTDILHRTPVWVMHNAKFDLQKLELVGALPAGWQVTNRVEDTQAIFHLLNENEKKGLKSLALTVLNYDDTSMVEYKSGKKKGQLHPVPKEKHQLDKVRRSLGLKVEDGYYWLPREVVIPYALRDTDFTLQLYERGRSLITERGLEDVYAEEIELIMVMLRMERNGFALNLEYLAQKTSEYGVKVMELTGELQELTGREDLKPGAPAQILEAFEGFGVTLEDTKEATLKKFEGKSGKAAELARLVLEYRSAKKIHTTYLAALMAEQRNGIVHPWFNLALARTGRMSSSKASE